MNQDYLCDKTGEDSEIEFLETTLQAFRYQEAAAPVLPVETIYFKKKTPRKTFWLAFAAAACLILGAAAGVIWLQISPFKSEVKQDLATAIEPLDNAALTAESTATPTNDFDIEKIINPTVESKRSTIKQTPNPKQFMKRKTIDLRKNVRALARQFDARKSRTTKPEIALTKTEQFAYERLMLALSITGAQLKIVRDKVAGTED